MASLAVWLCLSADGNWGHVAAQEAASEAGALQPPPQGAPQAQPPVQALETAIVQAIARAEKSVVAIARERPRLNVRGDDAAPPFFVERSPDDPEYVPHEFGTGVIIDRAGLIVTNHHVLGDPSRNRYWVWVNRRPYPAEVKAADPWLDLAVLKIAADNLEPIRFGDGQAVRRGQFVVSLGNPYAVARDGQPSATWGIVSNLSRKSPAARPAGGGAGTGASGGAASGTAETLHHYGTLIQVDCRLQWGSSGGALVNLQGDLIGLTTALAALEGFEAQAGFAIPVDDTFRRTVETLKAGRKPEYGFLGVAPELLPLDRRQRGDGGVVVRQIVPGTPAAQSKLQPGDRIVQVGGVPVLDSAELIRELSRRPADSQVQLAVLRTETKGQPPRTVEVGVELSKKYVGGPRLPYSQVPDPQWRGVRVEYCTAIAQFEERLSELDPDGCVALLEVQPQSPAWRAGLRPGSFVSHVEGRRVRRPADFYREVEGKDGAVRLRVTGARDTEAVRVVEAEP
ncbi:MAG: trypsin-like peptidase domain-containing protein [Pirellulales bacterium]